MYIRTRLALWLILIIAIVMIGFGVAIRSFFGFDTLKLATDSLRQRALAGAVLLTQNSSQSLQEQLDSLATPEYFFQLQDANGHVLASSANFGNTVLPMETLQQKSNSSQEVHVGNIVFLVYVQPVTLNGHTHAFLLVAHPDNTKEQGLSLLESLLYLIGFIALCVAALLVWLIVRKEMHPLEDLAATASRIAVAKDHSLRLHLDGPPNEINSLAATINGMLDSLDEAYQQVQKVNDLQRNFLADVSHELRTPLTIILSSLDILKKEGSADPEFQIETLESVHTEAERMSRMVTRLLVLARTDEGVSITREPILIVDILADVCRQAVQSNDKVALKCAGLENLEEAVVEGNADYLKQLFLILLENAFKYTPEGSQIEVTGEMSEDTLTVTVSDTGIGIAPKDLPHIFERFYRAENSRSCSGMGLGLAIAKSVAEQHSGHITVESESGQGSRFSVVLPLFAAARRSYL